MKKRKSFGKRGNRYVRTKRSENGPRNLQRVVKNIVQNQLTADNSYVFNYADQVVSNSVINAAATQTMWAMNQAASIGTTTNTIKNLVLDDPTDLHAIKTSINAAKTTGFTVKSRQKEVTITNAETSPCTIWEYRCMARQDIPLADATNPTINATLQGGFADATAGITAKTVYTDIGATPFMNPRFSHLFKIMKVKKRILQPAKYFTVKYSDDKNKKWNASRFAPNDVVYQMLRGQKISIFVAHGGYAVNSGANATYRFGMGNVSLGLIYKSRYHYSWIDDDTIATGATTNTAGYSANSITNGGFAPAPTVINHPDSVIEPLTYAAGAVTTAPTVGDRVYGTSGPGRFGIPDFATGS